MSGSRRSSNTRRLMWQEGELVVVVVGKDRRKLGVERAREGRGKRGEKVVWGYGRRDGKEHGRRKKGGREGKKGEVCTMIFMNGGKGHAPQRRAIIP